MLKLCINAGMGFDTPISENIAAAKNAGFDGIFHEWRNSEETAEYAREIKKHGLIYQSIHAPFTGMASVWDCDRDHDCDRSDTRGDAYIETLISCADDCSRYSVPIMVCHAFIGFKDHSPTEIGLLRLERLVLHAEKRGIIVAFENTEGEEYLDAIMKRFDSSPALGFCIDTGHEMCYNRSKDMISLYGKKLCATHLNDNLGITGDEITFLDDAHLMPFDGKADWKRIAQRLNKFSFNGPLTFELTKNNKPGRNTHDIYADMDINQFSREAYYRACKFAKLMQNNA